MSFVRMGQDGQYVDIPEGSMYYLYGDGENIGGWSYGQFAALIGSTIDEIRPEEDGTYGGGNGNVKNKFANHFDGWDEDYRGGIAPPERAEIFCQCVDSRIDGLTLSDELQEAAQEWAEEADDTLQECEYCGEEFRSKFDSNSCYDGECGMHSQADAAGVPFELVRQREMIFNELHERHGWDLKEANHEAWDYYEPREEEYWNE